VNNAREKDSFSAIPQLPRLEKDNSQVNQAKTLIKTSVEIVGEDLEKSGLSWQDLEPLGWSIINNSQELKETIGFSSIDGQDLIQATQAILRIPYPNTNFSRVKLYPPIEGAKYLQPKNTPPQPYILPEIQELKNKPHKAVIFTEGEKKTLCLIKHGYYAIGLPGVWQFKNQKQDELFLKEFEEWNWKERTVYICFDSDAKYNSNVVKAEIELALNLYARGAKVFIIRLPQPNHTDKVGVDDYITQEGIEAFGGVYDEAKPLFKAYPDTYYQEIIKSLAILQKQGTLLAGQVEHATMLLAKHWHIRKSTIEKDLKGYLPVEKEEKQSIVEELEPCSEEVNGIEIANQIARILKKYVYLSSEHYYTAITLWIFLTYAYDRFGILPMLLITSPTRRCGKTTLLTVSEGLANKALIASNISPPAVYRTVEKYKPTLLLDEADTSLARNEELRGIINAGHTERTASVVRTGSKETNFEPERFSTFNPKAIAMIGKPCGTWMDRSIHIKMERKTKDIHIEKLPIDFYEQMKPLRQKLIKWTCSDLRQIEEEFDLSNDRAVDNWIPLISVAYNLNDEWLIKAKKAMVFMESDEDEDDLKIELLQDIQQYFNEKGDKVFTEQLIKYLLSLEDRPWADLRHGKGITPHILANMLKAFGIKPKPIRMEYEVKKGYDVKDFKEVFLQYLPSRKVTRLQSHNDNDTEAFQKVTQKGDVPFLNSSKTASNQQCNRVTFQKGGITEETQDNEVIDITHILEDSNDL